MNVFVPQGSFEQVHFHLSDGNTFSINGDHPICAAQNIQQLCHSSDEDNDINIDVTLPSGMKKEALWTILNHFEGKQSPFFDKQSAQNTYKYVDFFNVPGGNQQVVALKKRITDFIEKSSSFENLVKNYYRYAHDLSLASLYERAFLKKITRTDFQTLHHRISHATDPLFKEWGAVGLLLMALHSSNQSVIQNYFEAGLSSQQIHLLKKFLSLLSKRDKDQVIESLPASFNQFLRKPKKIPPSRFIHWLPEKAPQWLKNITLFVESYVPFYPFDFLIESYRTIKYVQKIEHVNTQLIGLAISEKRDDIVARLHDGLINTTFSIDNSWRPMSGKLKPTALTCDDHKTHSARVMIQTALKIVASTTFLFASLAFGNLVGALFGFDYGYWCAGIPILLSLLTEIFRDTFSLTYQSILIVLAILTIVFLSSDFLMSLLLGGITCLLAYAAKELSDSFRQLFSNLYQDGLIPIQSRYLSHYVAKFSDRWAKPLLKMF